MPKFDSILIFGVCVLLGFASTSFMTKEVLKRIGAFLIAVTTTLFSWPTTLYLYDLITTNVNPPPGWWGMVLSTGVVLVLIFVAFLQFLQVVAMIVLLSYAVGGKDWDKPTYGKR